MIKNDRQRSLAKKKADDARTLAAEAGGLNESVYGEFAEDLETQVKEYDAIKAGYCRSFEISELDDLPDALVKCRLARGWSQAQLADALGTAEQQIQRFEAGGYNRAALWRLAEALDALGYGFKGVVKPHSEQPSGSWEIKKPYSANRSMHAAVGALVTAWQNVSRPNGLPILHHCRDRGARFARRHLAYWARPEHCRGPESSNED